MSDVRTILEQAMAASRTRASWNDRLTHWERPASDSEEAKIERAARHAREVVNLNLTLIAEEAEIRPQGSYFNNTNVRLEADMDLRVQLPSILIGYASGVDTALAYQLGGYERTERTFLEIANSVRDEIARDCQERFGCDNVTVGKKAVTVDGLSGSRADVDLVPAFHFHWISNNGFGGLHTAKGAVIFGADGSQTINFPEQHHQNGIAKRARTQHRFKKVVRMLKRLNYELADNDLIPKRVPSFLVECLVYIVDDAFFLMDEDRYDRLRRICRQILTAIQNMDLVDTLTEVNEIKFLFRPEQAWTLADATAFITAALQRLES